MRSRGMLLVVAPSVRPSPSLSLSVASSGAVSPEKVGSAVHLLAEVVWRDLTGVKSETGGDSAPKKDGARQLAGSNAGTVEVEHGEP